VASIEGKSPSLVPLTTNPLVLGLQLWTTKAKRHGEKDCKTIANFPSMLQNETQNPFHICVPESASKKKNQIAFCENSATSEYAS